MRKVNPLARVPARPTEALPAVAVPSAGLNILSNRLVRRLFLSRYLPLTLQVITILLFIWVVYDGLFGIQAVGDNFATLGVWFLFFWPVVLLSTILLGKAWCGVCPVGVFTGLANRFTLGRSFPKALRNGVLSFLFFVVVVWMMRPVLGISESPSATAWFFVAWTVVAVVLGFVYSSRSFCQYVCPLAGPLSILARIAPLELRARTSEGVNPACLKCPGKECINGNDKVGACPVGEYPAMMEGNQRCIFCLKCLKSCPTKTVLQIRLRWPFRELFRAWRPSGVEAWSVVAMVSVFLWHMALGHGDRVPPIFQNWAHSIGSLGSESSDHSGLQYVLILSIGLLVISGALAVAAYASAKVAHLSFRRSFVNFSFAYVALVAFRAVGYMVGDILTKSGDLSNYVTAVIGVYVYQPSAVVDGMFKPFLQGTGYHPYGALLTVPLLAALPLTWFIAYKTARHMTSGPAKALAAATPHFLLSAGIVVLYEWAYLVGYRVIGQ